MSKLAVLFLDPSLWAGALIGVLVSAAFAASSSAMKSFIQRLPRRKLLGSLGDDSQPCEISMRQLFHDRGDFVSFLGGGRAENIQNTQYVYGTGDVEAAMRVINLLGQVRHSSKIRVVAIQEAAKLQDLPSVAVGSTPRAAEVLGLVPELGTSFSADKIFSGGREFGVDDSGDHAVIFRASGGDIHYPHFAIFGLHWIGSRAAGIFLEKHAATLGSIFGKTSFVVVLRSPMSTDTSKVAIVYYAPGMSWFVKLIHPIAFHRFSKLLVSPL